MAEGEKRKNAEWVLTFDIDWVPDPVLEDTLELLASHGIKATFFATHDSPVVRSIEEEGHELGIHPNFNDLLNGKGEGDFKRPVDELLELFPNAQGVRSHSLTSSGPLLGYFSDCGLSYDANLLIPYHQIEPFQHCSGIHRIPFFWEDDVHFLYERPFELEDLGGLKTTKTYIFNFHPFHIYSNTYDIYDFEQKKRAYHRPNELYEMRNKSKNYKGVRDFFCEIIAKFNYTLIINIF